METTSKNRAFTVFKKGLRYMAIGIFCLLFILVIWLFADKFILKSPVPSVFGYSALTVKTGSMSGEIEAGDMVVIRNTGDYEIGDIITFLQEGESVPTTHRIVGCNVDGSFITKGDANNTEDVLPVSADIIFGEVIGVLPGVGFFSEWLQSEGWVYIVALLVIFGVGTMLVRTFSEQDGKDDGGSQSTDNSDNTERENNAKTTDNLEE